MNWPGEIETRLLGAIHRSGPLSRWDLHKQTGVRANTVGKLATSMLEKGLVRETDGRSPGPGRPTVRLAVEGTPWRVMGIMVRRAKATACLVDGLGEVVEVFPAVECARPADVIRGVAHLITRQLRSHPAVICIGLCVPGFADYRSRRLLLSTAAPGEAGLSLEPIFAAAGSCPLVLDNDMSGVAARWWLTHSPGSVETTLVVLANDGAIGGSVLINGRPNLGSVLGGAELGHMRFAVATDRCTCGRTGCLARIFSSAYVHRLTNGRLRTLSRAVDEYEQENGVLRPMVEHLATGIANAINLLRPHRLVLITEFAHNQHFVNDVAEATRTASLEDIASHLVTCVQPDANGGAALDAAYRALAAIYSNDWRMRELEAHDQD